ncbi:spore germination protein [Paenibacillus mendelii]|uniref:Spore germination protein n=1 Tax=Paenibacillus mendelii TaxID=206163 RepID=A0ABV6JI02_9BACL|nr:spore germination protein [Paenibacillus mendelii]MCQ6557984.1 spore germination protein [Paenibacillus mendelii]
MAFFSKRKGSARQSDTYTSTKGKGGKQTDKVEPLTADLDVNARVIGDRLGGSLDIVLRELRSAGKESIRLIVVYIDSIVDHRMIQEGILSPLADSPIPPLDLQDSGQDNNRQGSIIVGIAKHILSIGTIRSITTIEEALEALLGGSCLILAESEQTALAADVSGGEQRAVTEASTQTVIRGPQHSFTENCMTNIGLLRRIIRSSELRIHCLYIGRHTNTRIAVVYIEGIADAGVVNEMNRRLRAIDIDGVLESGYVEEFIQDKTFTPFPTLMNVERPDVVAAGLLEGQVAVIVDGTPFVLLAPVTFFKFFQSAEDYYQRYDISTFLRMLRHFAFVVSMLLPATYIAVTTFHQEMLPTTLLISLAAQREGVPFPALAEALLMEITFEVLREAGVRMPRAIGPAISIVGALVLGQAAVQAGLVSPAMVIAVSFTAISNFVTPQFNIAIAARLIRFSLMLLAGALGFFGIITGIIVVLTHLAGLRSFGVPYMTPAAPLLPSSLKDILIRVPRWAMSTRPLAIGGGKRKKDAKAPPWQRRSSGPEEE